MGQAHSVGQCESYAAAVKTDINAKVDDYLSFLKNTNITIDEEIEDLSSELAVVTCKFRESELAKKLSASEFDRLVADVETHANKQKTSVRRLFAALEESSDL